MENFKETIIFSSTDTEGRVNMQSIKGEDIHLSQLAQLFKDFLVANGYPSVQFVTINNSTTSFESTQ